MNMNLSIMKDMALTKSEKEICAGQHSFLAFTARAVENV